MTEQFPAGSRENPLPVPDDILSGKSAWRGTFYENGLFLNVDDHLWYQYPPPYPPSWKTVIDQLAAAWERKLNG